MIIQSAFRSKEEMVISSLSPEVRSSELQSGVDNSDFDLIQFDERLDYFTIVHFQLFSITGYVLIVNIGPANPVEPEDVGISNGDGHVPIFPLPYKALTVTLGELFGYFNVGYLGKLLMGEAAAIQAEGALYYRAPVSRELKVLTLLEEMIASSVQSKAVLLFRLEALLGRNIMGSNGMGFATIIGL